MSVYQNALCSLVMREFYGEVVEKVSVFLLKKGLMPLGVIAQETKLKIDQVKRALAVLLQQNIAYFIPHKRGFVEYSVDAERMLLRPRFPRYVYTAKTLYGDHAELLIEELLQHGQVTVSSLVNRVTTRVNEAFQDGQKVTTEEVWQKFADLAETHFVQRCPEVADAPKTKVPSFCVEPEHLYSVPPMDVDLATNLKRKRSGHDGDTPPGKRQKRDPEEQEPSLTVLPPGGMYWRVNYSRFHHYMRDQALITATTNKIDQKAAEVVRTILRISEVKSDVMAGVTLPLSSHDIFNAMPKEVNLTKIEVDQYLNLLAEDSSDFVIKAGDSGGGMYSVHIKKALATLATAHIESVVHERFGSKSLRIFKLLLMKRQLEQKQIEEYAMIPAKEAKEMLYRMFGENFISLTEVPRTPDHAPARTFYLFSVRIEPIARMLLNQCYKTVANLIIRREHETKDNKRLLEKQQRVEAIASSLEQTGADPTQKEEIEDMISPPERAQLAKVKHMTNKLEQSELQLDDTIFILELYLKYINSTT